MQKWPDADFAHYAVEYFPFTPQRAETLPKREHLIVETVFASENAVMFFDHYAKEYKRQKSELEDYFEKLTADGWKLTTASNFFQGRGYQFRCYLFRRSIES